MHQPGGAETSGERGMPSGCIDYNLRCQFRTVGKAADDAPFVARDSHDPSANPTRTRAHRVAEYAGVEARAINDEAAASRMPEEVVDLDPSGWQPTADAEARTGDRRVPQQMRNTQSLEELNA